jgi:L-asparaginase II
VAERNRLICTGDKFCQLHNNCSGKHAGFRDAEPASGRACPDYVEVDHPVQRAVRAAFEEVTGEDSPGYGIDGCSAPEFRGVGTRAGRGDGGSFAVARTERATRGSRRWCGCAAPWRATPRWSPGETRACTELMRAMDGTVAIKTGAEAVFIAILPHGRGWVWR